VRKKRDACHVALNYRRIKEINRELHEELPPIQQEPDGTLYISDSRENARKTSPCFFGLFLCVFAALSGPANAFAV
jgi:hypothetical protein